jgi:hypothetical protein
MQELVKEADLLPAISPRKTESRQTNPRDTADTPHRATQPVT